MPTYWEHLVHEYTGLNVNEIEELEYIDYLQYRRDAFVHEMNKTEEGREYLETHTDDTDRARQNEGAFTFRKERVKACRKA